jgi:hypothetical protein
MNKLPIVSLALTATVALAACGPQSNKDDKDKSVNKAQLAHDFATQLSGSIVPILETEEPLQEFGEQLSADFEELNGDQLDAMGDAMDTLFSDLGDYLDSAITEDLDGDVTDIDWSLLADAAANVNGVAFDIEGTTLTVTGTDVEGSSDLVTNTIDASFVISLPSTTISNNTVVLAASSFSITDDFSSSISANSASVNVTFDSATELEGVVNGEPEVTAVDVQLTNGEIVLGGAVTLSGNGSVSVAHSFVDSGNTETESMAFEFNMGGSIENSTGATFSATVEGDFDYVGSDTVNGDLETETMDLSASLEIVLELTEVNISQAYMTARLAFDLDAEDSWTYNNFYGTDSGESDLDLAAEVELTVGSAQWGLGFDFDATFNDSTEEVALSIKDITNSEHDVVLTLLVNAQTNLDEETILIGHIKVDGIKQADVVIHAEANADYPELVADFDSLSDVLLISATQLEALEESF